MLVLLIASALAGEMPEWTRGNTLERSGTALSVVCIGHGPSLDLAREQANNACRSEAIRQVQVNFSVHAESIESEHDVAFHQQITTHTSYSGVDCKPVKESIDAGQDQTTVFLKCIYDLSKIKSTAIVEEPKLIIAEHLQAQDVPAVYNVKEKGYKKDSSRHIILSTFPEPCDTVIVRSALIDRAIPCTENPQVITVNIRKDNELVIRPRAKGYMPKAVTLSDDVPSTLEVQFEQQ
jgi:hypothetical protein